MRRSPILRDSFSFFPRATQRRRRVVVFPFPFCPLSVSLFLFLLSSSFCAQIEKSQRHASRDKKRAFLLTHILVKNQFLYLNRKHHFSNARALAGAGRPLFEQKREGTHVEQLNLPRHQKMPENGIPRGAEKSAARGRVPKTIRIRDTKKVDEFVRYEFCTTR